tara:strand:+ start:19 stop:1398 length:1380 start_codon:yes stop_codon:yes gene_type:complete
MLSDLVIVAIFLMLNIAIGFISRKKNNTLENFSVGDRNFNAWFIFATLSATFIGGGFTIGNASKVYSSGIYYSLALMGFSLKEILVATFIAPRMDAHRDCVSIGDLIYKTYGKWPKIITGFLSLFVCMGILGAQVGAMGAICQEFFSVSPIWGITIGFAVLIFYSSLGGMRAVVYTDVLQFSILAIGIPAVFFIGLEHVGGWQQLAAKLPAHYLDILPMKKDRLFIASLFITFILGETLVPPYVQRLLMSKHGQVTRRGTLASGLFSIPFFLIAGGIGLLAYALNPSIDPNLSLPYVVKVTAPLFVRGIIVASLIAIIMSSASGFLNSASIVFVNDILKPMRVSTKSINLLRCAQLTTIVVGIGAVMFALLIHNVLDILLVSYNFWAPVMLVPLIAAIFQCNVNAYDFIVGAVSGVIAMALWAYLLNRPFGISPLVIGVMFNAAAFFMTGVLYKRSIKD